MSPSAFCQNVIFLNDKNIKRYKHYIDVLGRGSTNSMLQHDSHTNL